MREHPDWQIGTQSPIEDRLMIAIGDLADWQVQRRPFTTFEDAKSRAEWIIHGRQLLIVPQCRVGRYRLDLAVFARRNATWCKIKAVGIECDGWEYHSSPEQIARDAERDAKIRAATGVEIFRFTGRSIMREPVACAELALASLFEFQQHVSPWSEEADLVDNGEWWDA